MITTEQADIKFSKLIRHRDPICVRCRRRKSDDCSHYWERGHSSTRYDPENADGLCRGCHQIWEGRTEGYEEYKRDQLGDEGYEALEKKHNAEMQRSDALIEFEKLYDDHKKSKRILQYNPKRNLTPEARGFGTEG